MPVQTGTITATGQTTPVTLGTKFNLSLWDFGAATIALERSFDGLNWGSVEAFTANAEKIGESHERAQYRLNCTAYTSGTIAYRISG